jgi:hypothetical protein
MPAGRYTARYEGLQGRWLEASVDAQAGRTVELRLDR